MAVPTDYTDEQIASSERTVFETKLAECNAKIAAMQEAMPWNVRIIDAAAFVARIPQALLVDLFTSADEKQQQIATMLKTYRENDWPILFDSPEMQESVGYLVQSGAITEKFSKELTRDSSKDEAYRDGE